MDPIIATKVNSGLKACASGLLCRDGCSCLNAHFSPR